MQKIFLGFLLSLFLSSSGYGVSTAIDDTIPVTGSTLQSTPIRNNFVAIKDRLDGKITSASYTDINEAVAACTNITLEINEAETITGTGITLIVPFGCHLEFTGSGSINDGDSNNLAFATGSSINAPINQHIFVGFDGGGGGVIELGWGGNAKEVYPQWWGAKGNSVHDDTSAIQAAVDAVKDLNGAAGGIGRIFFPNGIYPISSTITVTSASNFQLEGATYSNTGGSKSVIVWAGAAGGAMFDFVASTDIVISKLGLYGATTAGYGIRFRNGPSGMAQALLIQDLVINGVAGSPGYGVVLGGPGEGPAGMVNIRIYNSAIFANTVNLVSENGGNQGISLYSVTMYPTDTASSYNIWAKAGGFINLFDNTFSRGGTGTHILLSSGVQLNIYGGVFETGDAFIKFVGHYMSTMFFSGAMFARQEEESQANFFTTDSTGSGSAPLTTVGCWFGNYNVNASTYVHHTSISDFHNASSTLVKSANSATLKFTPSAIPQFILGNDALKLDPVSGIQRLWTGSGTVGHNIPVPDGNGESTLGEDGAAIYEWAGGAGTIDGFLGGRQGERIVVTTNGQMTLRHAQGGATRPLYLKEGINYTPAAGVVMGFILDEVNQKWYELSRTPLTSTVTVADKTASATNYIPFVTSLTGSLPLWTSSTKPIEFNPNTGNTKINGDLTATGGFQSGASAGASGTIVVKGSDGNNCNLVFTGGLLTSDTCP